MKCLSVGTSNILNININVGHLTQQFTEPSEGISWTLHMFHKTEWPSVYTLHSNSIPPTDGTNGLLWLVAYMSQTGYQGFPAWYCPPTVENVDVYLTSRQDFFLSPAGFIGWWNRPFSYISTLHLLPRSITFNRYFLQGTFPRSLICTANTPIHCPTAWTLSTNWQLLQQQDLH